MKPLAPYLVSLLILAVAAPTAEAGLREFAKWCFTRSKPHGLTEAEKKLAQFREWRDRKPPSLHGKSQEEENAMYREAIANLPPKNNERFVYVSLKPLRDLNAGVLDSKEDVDSARNLFRDIFLRKVHEDPVLASYLRHQSIGFKEMELHFREVEQDKIALFERRLDGVWLEAQMEFDKRLREYIAPEMEDMQRFLQQRGLVSDLREWHHAGMGIGHPNFAAWQTGAVEFDWERPNPLTVKRFDVAKAYTSVEEAEANRQKLSATKRGTAWMGRYELTDQFVLSRAALEIIRPIKDLPMEQATKIIIQQAREDLGVNLTQAEAEASFKYYIAQNRFQPPVRAAEPVVFQYETATNGLLTVDFGGQGHINAYHTMGALLEASKLTERQGIRAVEISSAYDNLATKRLQDLQTKFRDAMVAAGIEGNIVFSGDDGACALPSGITGKQFEKLLKELAKHPQLADFRTVYSPKGKKPPTSADHTRAEKFEKKLRQELKSKLGGRLSKFSFSSYVDRDNGNLLIFVGGKPTAEEMGKIRAAAEKQSPFDGLVLSAIAPI